MRNIDVSVALGAAISNAKLRIEAAEKRRKQIVGEIDQINFEVKELYEIIDAAELLRKQNPSLFEKYEGTYDRT